MVIQVLMTGIIILINLYKPVQMKASMSMGSKILLWKLRTNYRNTILKGINYHFEMQNKICVNEDQMV